jgi:hypothetical protein
MQHATSDGRYAVSYRYTLHTKAITFFSLRCEYVGEWNDNFCNFHALIISMSFGNLISSYCDALHARQFMRCRSKWLQTTLVRSDKWCVSLGGIAEKLLSTLIVRHWAIILEAIYRYRSVVIGLHSNACYFYKQHLSHIVCWFGMNPT